jgi:hypothetical protein
MYIVKMMKIRRFFFGLFFDKVIKNATTQSKNVIRLSMIISAHVLRER